MCVTSVADELTFERSIIVRSTVKTLRARGFVALISIDATVVWQHPDLQPLKDFATVSCHRLVDKPLPCPSLAAFLRLNAICNLSYTNKDCPHGFKGS